MKGPMTTQTLRGLATHGGMHWRGDRVDGFFGTDACTEPSGAPCNEDLSFRNFIVAFEGLVGQARHDHAGADAAVHGLRARRSCCRRTRCAASTTR